MNVVLFVGSPRVPSNTRSIVAGLRARLEAADSSVVTLDPKRGDEAADAFLSESIAALRCADAVVIAAPVYLDLPPHRTLAWLHGLLERREALDGSARSVYAISHSGYFEPIHKAVSLRALRHFCQRMGWTWRGGLAFGGTSPIDGRRLEEAGPFSRRVRPALDALADVVIGERDIPQDVIVRAGRSPIPLPRFLIVWLMNQMLKRRSL